MIQEGIGQTGHTDKPSLTFPGFSSQNSAGYSVCALVTESRVRAYARL